MTEERRKKRRQRAGRGRGAQRPEGLHKNDLSAKQLGKWTRDFETGVDWIRKLVRAFYTKEFSFGGFMKEYPQHAGNLTDLLIGKVFDGEPGAIFKDMDPWIEKAKNGEMAKT